jgi:hypothetical protein
MKTYTRVIFVCLLSIIMIVSQTKMAAGQNLPETKVPPTKITGKRHATLRKYFLSVDDITDDFDQPIEKILMDLLPGPYKTGCKEMVNLWGPKAKGTSALLPRGIYMNTMPDSVIHIFLAYTCYSSAQGFGDHYYDERLALLTIERTASTFSMLPFSEQCTQCSELSRIGLSEDTLQIADMPVISIVSSISNDNPCCNGSRTLEERYRYYYKLDNHSVTPVASFLEYRKESGHFENGSDSIAEYSATRWLEFDKTGNISKIVSNYTEAVTNQPTKAGIITLIWNRKRQAFDKEGN